MKLAIFTDLDGTLLDHADYSFAEARPSLSRIAAAGIPLVMVTSKTRAEVEELQCRLGTTGPFIVENGGGIFFGKGSGLNIPGARDQGPYLSVRLGTTYARLRNFIEKVKGRFGLRGFGDLTPAEVSVLTGLSLKEARLAKEREFSEPFLLEWPGHLPRLAELARREGLAVTSGGRFYHLIRAGQDKGKAVRVTAKILRQKTRSRLKTIGLGDAENDLSMLRAVDIPVLIRRPNGSYTEASLPGLIRSSQTGSRGWNEVVGRLLDELSPVKPS